MEWISVEKDVPEYKREVLLFIVKKNKKEPFSIHIGCRKYTNENGDHYFVKDMSIKVSCDNGIWIESYVRDWGMEKNRHYATITHWMLLPNPPEKS